MANKKLTNGLEILRTAAIARGGECLATEYNGVDEKCSFRCVQGHEWESTYYRVVNKGNWCAICSGRKVIPNEILKKAIEMAKSKGGVCLSKKYVKSTAKMQWRCKEGHEWEASHSNTVNHRKWCPWCSGNRVDAAPRHQSAIDYAITRGGECLSTSYKSNKSAMRWRCSNGHKWNAGYTSVVSNGSWCAICEGSGRIPEEQLKKAQEIAISKNGLCLSASYTNNREPMKWKCERNHDWEAPFYVVVQAGSWCPVCSSGLKERLSRNALEQLFGLLFPKTRFSWLKNPKSGRLLELDGYNKTLNIAFEYHGPQHYMVINPFKMTEDSLEESRYRDSIKKSLCSAHGIEIIEIPYIVEAEDFLEYISDHIHQDIRFSHLVSKIKNWRFLTQTDWTESENYSIESLKNYAQNLSGDCLSTTYLGTKSKHKWVCSIGHKWESSWDSVHNNGSWCPVCCGNVIVNPMAELQRIAKEKGGKCLSPEYLGSTEKLKWQCANGHVWETKPSHIKSSGSWCPHCSRKKKS